MARRRGWMTDEQYREFGRDEKRRQRAKRYALGLNSKGQPSNPATACLERRLFMQHPAGCPCYDCLYPALEPGAAIEAEINAAQLRRMVRS